LEVAQLSFGTLKELSNTYFWEVTPQTGVIGSNWKFNSNYFQLLPKRTFFCGVIGSLNFSSPAGCVFYLYCRTLKRLFFHFHAMKGKLTTPQKGVIGSNWKS